MLYLLKASRIAEYHQQNVAILGAAEGDRFVIRYGHRWVQTGLQVTVGDGTVIAFSDTPYRDFVPVRFAKVVRFASLPEHVEIEVSLGPWVHADDRAVLSRRWGARTDADRPGKRFLLSDENPGLRTPASRDEIDAGWRAAVGDLRNNEFFARTVIARLRHLVLEDGTPVDDETHVVPGDTVRAVIDVLSPRIVDDAVRVIADFRPVGAGEIPPDSVVTVPGTAEIPIRLLAPGACRVRIRFLPEPLQSSRPVFSLVAAEPARAAAAVEEPAPPSGADQAASRLPRLVARLERDARLDGDVWIGLYEDVILDWMPRNTGLVEKYAAHLLAAGQFDKTTQVLDGLEDRSPDGDHMLLVASIRAGEPFDASALLPGIDLTADGPFNELLDALRKAGGEVWRQLLDPLPHKLLGDDKSHTFLLAAREHVTDEPSCIQIVEALAYVDTEAASNFAMQRWQDPGTTPSEVVDLLLQFDANRAHLLPYVEARLADLAAAGEWDDYEKTFTRAREELRDSDRRLLTSLAARHMLRSEQQGVCDRGLDLEIEASHEALALGDLDASLRAATIARAYALTRHDAEYESATKYLLDALERTIRETELFRQYEEAGQDLRAARRREWLSGKRLHIVGGQAADWQDTVRIECGLSKVTWHPAERHKAPTLDWAGGLRSADDVVVCLTDSIGHKTSGPLKDTCAKRNVPYVPADWGKRSVLDALADAAAAAADAAATSKEA